MRAIGHLARPESQSKTFAAQAVPSRQTAPSRLRGEEV